MSAAYIALAAVAAPFLVVSGAAKIAALADAPRTLDALRVRLPRPRAFVAAVSAGEIVLGLLLVVLDGLPRVLAAAATLVAMLAFTVLVRRAVRAGSTRECGCLGRLTATPLSPALVDRNVVFSVVSIVLVAAAAVAAGDRMPPLAETIVIAPASTALLALAGAGLVFAGVALERASRRPRQPAPTLDGYPRPALLREDGLVVDTVQLALQGRAQLLLFSQPLCGACERAQAVLDENRHDLADVVDARIVYAAGHGVDWNAPARTADGPRTGAALDIAGMLARTLDIDADRPVAVLIGTNGQAVLPYAHGAEQVAGLVGAIVAAGRAADI